MAKRFTDTELWDKEWFMALSSKHKLLIKYLFDKCDVAGIWSPNWGLASTYVGEKVTSADLLVFKKHIDTLPDGKIFVVDFIQFQYGELSENCAPHKKIISILKKSGLYERVLKGYFKSKNTLKEEEEDKEMEEEAEKEKEFSQFKKTFDAIVQSVSPEKSTDSREFHNEISKILRKEGFKITYEYPVPQGRIDIVVHLEKLNVAVEVDNRTPRGKSILKLVNTGFKTVSVLRDPKPDLDYTELTDVFDQVVLYKNHPSGQNNTGGFEFSLQTDLPKNILEAAERNQFTHTQKNNTEFIKSQWKVFLSERMNDPPNKKYKQMADLTGYFLNWIRNKHPKVNGNNSGNISKKPIPTGEVSKGGFGSL